MILVTGAGGKTGQAIVRALSHETESVRAFVHAPEKVALLERCGAEQVLVGDQMEIESMRQACKGIRAIYHICPNMSTDERRMAEIVIEAARANDVEHFVYHSVLHPQVEAMPHHWEKLHVEELIFVSGLPFTILQPAPYMQNVLSFWDSITREGIYPVPYAVKSRLSMVDLNDVAMAAACVLTEYGHTGAVYELAGSEVLTQVEVAQALSTALNRPVTALAVDRGEWEQKARASGKLPDYAVETLLKMFIYYEEHGLTGNPRVLQWLLSRQPAYFADFLEKVVVKGA